MKRTVDDMLDCKQTEFSPEKRRLVRHINAHTDQKYTAVSANPQKKRDRSRWLWRQCMKKCDGDENIAASLIHDAATSLTNVRVNACAHSSTHPYNIALNIPTTICSTVFLYWSTPAGEGWHLYYVLPIISSEERGV